MYSKKKISLRKWLMILKSWAIRFDKKYLEQTYFEPYLENLVEISDYEKSRDY